MTDDLRILTVRQPWGTGIIHLDKTPENRKHNIAGTYRGLVAIHAGLTIDDRAADNFVLRDAWHHAGLPTMPVVGHPGLFEPILQEPDGEDVPWLPRGVVIGVVELVDVHHADDCWQGIALLDGTTHTELCSPWAMPDHHHLELTNPRPLTTRIPARGRQGLWRPDEELRTAIFEQLGVPA